MNEITAAENVVNDDVVNDDVVNDDVDGAEVRSIIERMRSKQSQWRALPLRARLQVIARLRRLVARHADELCQCVVRPAAQPGEVFASEILPLAEACHYVARRGLRALRPRRLSSRDGAWWMGSVRIQESREPWGLVLIIGPSNYPLLLPGVQVLQALAAGNAALVKPAPHCDLVMHKLCELCHLAGVPKGLLAILETDPAAARAAIEVGVDKVIFTGSFSAGRKVAKQLVKSMTPAAMELSGNDPVFVLEGADLKRVARAVAYALELNGGQTCIAPRRLFANQKNMAALIPLLRAELHNSPPRTIQHPSLRVAQEEVTQAIEHGAEIVCGQLSDFGPAGQVTPLVLSKVTANMRVATEDIFAPVLSLIEVDEPATALRLAENCRYALGASVFGASGPATEFASQIVAGCVCINDVLVPTADPRVSFGGWRGSGYGVTRGLEGLREMSQLKVTCERRGRWLPHLSTPAPKLQRMLRGILLLRHGGSLSERWSGLSSLIKAARKKS